MFFIPAVYSLRFPTVHRFLCQLFFVSVLLSLTACDSGGNSSTSSRDNQVLKDYVRTPLNKAEESAGEIEARDEEQRAEIDALDENEAE